MAIQINQATRVFSYNGVELPDPGVNMSTEEVKEIYAITYPELNNATVEGPDLRGNTLVFKFTRAVGTKV